MHKWRRKGSSRYQTCFSVVHIRCSITEIDVIAQAPQEERTYACAGCTLAMTMDQSSVVVDQRDTQTDLQAFRYAVNLSAERSVRVLYADAMCSRPPLTCSKYLRRHQAQPHLHGLQLHGCSTRHRVRSLENKMKYDQRCAPLESHHRRISQLVYAMSREEYGEVPASPTCHCKGRSVRRPRSREHHRQRV